MIVNKLTFIPKRGCRDQLVELFKAQGEHIAFKGRILVPEFGPSDLVVIENEFPDMDAYLKFMAKANEEMASSGFFEKHAALTENGGTNEIWNVVLESR